MLKHMVLRTQVLFIIISLGLLCRFHLAKLNVHSSVTRIHGWLTSETTELPILSPLLDPSRRLTLVTDIVVTSPAPIAQRRLLELRFTDVTDEMRSFGQKKIKLVAFGTQIGLHHGLSRFIFFAFFDLFRWFHFFHELNVF